MEKIAFRNGTVGDTAFIYSTWLKSYRHLSFFAIRIPAQVYYEYHKQIIARILNEKTTEVLIACSHDEPNTIFGYMVWQRLQKPVIHYVYVKGDFQGMGIGTEIILESKIDLKNVFFTHWTYATNWIIEKHPDMTYNPYIV